MGWGVQYPGAQPDALYAGFGLVYEGVDYGLWRTVLGVVLGLAFIVLTRMFLQLRKRWPVGFTEMGTLDARKALLAVGVSFVGGQDLGLFITLAISPVPVPRGVGWFRAALWSVFTSRLQPLMAVPAFLFEAFSEGHLACVWLSRATVSRPPGRCTPPSR